jgi:hypothetical protein
LEELCTEAKLVVAVNRSGELCGLQKGQDGGIEPSLLLEMIQVRTERIPFFIHGRYGRYGLHGLHGLHGWCR